MYIIFFNNTMTYIKIAVYLFAIHIKQPQTKCPTIHLISNLQLFAKVENNMNIAVGLKNIS